jgi:hypothetical protein
LELVCTNEHQHLSAASAARISSALHEATEIDRMRARYVNDNLADYLVPVSADVQDIEIILVPEEHQVVNAAGVKGRCGARRGASVSPPPAFRGRPSSCAVGRSPAGR